MKRNLTIWILALLLTGSTAAMAATSAQSHRHTPRTTVVDAKAKQQASADSAAAAEAAVAYSDTTSTADDEWEDESQPSAYRQQYRYELTSDQAFAERIFDKIAESGMIIVIIVFLLFVVSPLLILLMIFYFINRNRRDRIRLAEMALKNGQPIPGTERIIYREAKPREERQAPQSMSRTQNKHAEYTYNEDLRTRGIMHLAIGLGLMVCCLSFWNNDFFGGIGFLIACFGAGQIFMARSPKKVVEEQPTAEEQPSKEQPTAEEQPTKEQPTAEEQPSKEEPKADEVKDLTIQE